MNLIEAKNEADASIEAGNAVLLISGSGIGKSQIMRQMFLERKERDAKKGISWGYGQIFAATQTPPDLIGYQFKGEKVFDFGNGETKAITITNPSVPLWFISDEGKPAFMYDKFFLVIDEYGQGEPDVKRAIAEIFLNGGTSPWYLPTGSVRMAASNEGARYGVTKDFDFAIARRTTLRINGDAKIWDDNFASKPYIYQGRKWQTMGVTRAWAVTNPMALFEAEPKEQGPWCNPRSLCAADRYLQIKAERNNGVVPTDGPTIENLSGTIGMPATTSLVGHIQFALDLPKYEDVVADPANTPVPTKPDLLMLMAYQLADRTQPKHLAECIQYMQRMPKDMSVTYVSALLRRDYKQLANMPAMQGWISKNASLVSVISALSQ